jgi:hypothetical protein
MEGRGTVTHRWKKYLKMRGVNQTRELLINVRDPYVGHGGVLSATHVYLDCVLPGHAYPILFPVEILV